jgi:hypothetical protein
MCGGSTRWTEPATTGLAPRITMQLREEGSLTLPIDLVLAPERAPRLDTIECSEDFDGDFDFDIDLDDDEEEVDDDDEDDDDLDEDDDEDEDEDVFMDDDDDD